MSKQLGPAEKTEDFSELLESLGSKGKYQKILLYVVVVPIATILPTIIFSPIFLFYVPDHWCHMPETKNFTSEQLLFWKNQSLPLFRNWTCGLLLKLVLRLVVASLFHPNAVIGHDGHERHSQCQVKNSGGDIIDCPYGWDYDRGDFVETMASEFDWVCSKAHYPTTLFTVIQVGFVIGTIVFGILADKIGKRPIFFISLALYLILRLVSLFIPQYFIGMVIVTLISSMGYPMVNVIPNLIIAELCDDAFRAWVYALTALVCVVGMAAVPYISYFGGHWFIIGLVTTVPSFLSFLSWFLIPESPRWLTSVGLTEKAAKILYKVAKVNGTHDKFSLNELEKTLEVISQSQRKKDVNKPTMITFFKRETLAKRLGFITVSWAASNLIYECITLNTPNMSGDQFLNFFLLAIVEAPSGFIGGYLIGVLGRRWTGVIFFLICCVASIAAAVFLDDPSLPIFVIVATFISKFSINVTHLVVSLQTTELLPTPLRSSGTSFSSSVSSCVGILVPTIVYSANDYVAAPYLVMGMVAAIGMVTSSFLPETIRQDLPETIEAANEFGKEYPYWNCRVSKSKRKNTSDVLPD